MLIQVALRVRPLSGVTVTLPVVVSVSLRTASAFVPATVKPWVSFQPVGGPRAPLSFSTSSLKSIVTCPGWKLPLSR